MLPARVWPSTLLPARVMFHPDIPSASGGPTPLGSEQVVFSSAGRWMAELTMNVRPSITTPRPRDRILAARSMIAWMQGRTRGIFIGPFDMANSPAAIAGDTGPIEAIPFDDDTLFDDDTGFDQPRTSAYPAAAVVAEAMSMGIVIQNAGYVIEAGQYFGFGDNELYLVNSSVFDADTSIYTVDFWPPMRSDHATDEPVNLDNPTCLMRNSADNSGSISFEAFFSGQQTLTLVEEN